MWTQNLNFTGNSKFIIPIKQSKLNYQQKSVEKTKTFTVFPQVSEGSKQKTGADNKRTRQNKIRQKTINEAEHIWTRKQKIEEF